MNLEQQRAHYKAVRARIAGAAAPRPLAPVAAVPSPPEPVEPPPDPVASLPVAQATRDGLRCVLDAYGATWDDVVGPSRRTCYDAPRRAIYWLLHCRGFSTVSIGRLTRRDHSSIVYALSKVNPWTRKQS